MKTSFVTTVLNEEKSISSFIESILGQTRKPDEVIIVDGGSSDRTVAKIKDQISKIKNNRFAFKLLVKKGNRAVGRNEGIRNAKGDIILISDAGCFLDKKWVEKITEPFNDKKVDVVAGYYKGKARSIFEKCLIPYVLVMPNKVNPKYFLPATRSMAFKKSIWEKIAGFNEKFSHNEDYVFAHKLRSIGAKILVQKEAIVNWVPRKNLIDSFKMFFRFAFGDAESGIYRPKVLLVFARYLIFPYLIFLGTLYKSFLLFFIIAISLLFYILWSIGKNYKYVKNREALYFLPLIQITSDVAVLLGTISGFLKRLSINLLFKLIKKYKLASYIIVVYIFSMLSILNWGIPNTSHPFTYHMDEWHQLQAVRSVFEKGSPNVEGAAHGSIFQFFLSGVYLVPFVLLGIINPFDIKSSVGSLDVQQNLFIILRINTLIFGVLSTILIAFIGKKYFNISPFLTSFLFAINPLMISLSNYFKYDIALTFWLLLSLKFLLSYGENPTFKKYCYAGIVCSLALSTKISALPIIPIFILAYFLFTKNALNKVRYLLFGLLVFTFTFLLFGIPDIIFGQKDMWEYLRSNLINTPREASNLMLGVHYLFFLFVSNYPASFGHFLFYIFILAFIINFLGSARKLFIKNYIFLYLSFSFFSLSLIPLKFDARGNRLLTILPFIVLITGIFLTTCFRFFQRINIARGIFFVLLFFLLSIQAFETFAWISVKLKTDPRVASSIWIEKNIQKDSVIGIENIPIYQSVPDFILKDYYEKQYDNRAKTKYKYDVIDYKASKIPNIVILTNDEVSEKYLKKSPKKMLLNRLKKEGYKKVAKFQPNFYLFKFIGNELDFFYSQLPAIPNTISIFKK